MRTLLFIAAIFSATGNALADERPSFVPPPAADEQRLDDRSLRALFVDGATECTKYDAKTHTCNTLSIYAQRNGQIMSINVAVMFADPKVELAMEYPLDIEGDTVCGDMREAEVRVISSDLPSEVTLPMQTELRREVVSWGKVCSIYVRAGEAYITRSWKQNGERVLPGEVTLTRFFPQGVTPPTLRTFKVEATTES